MDCWIGHVDQPDRRIVRLAGRLSSEQVPDLLRLCGDRNERQLVINLADLLGADAVGIEALRRLRREGATLVKMSEYLRLKLD